MTEEPQDIPARCLGETGALNLSGPTDQDIKNTKDLELGLSKLDLFESQEEILRRREALVKLQEIANNWIRSKALEQNLPVHIANNTSGKIFTFGSYRLGVNFRGADVDSLFVVPRFITREEFFNEFAKILEENENVETIHSVINAFVPVLKMTFYSVEIDLLFAKVDAMTIPENFNLCENTESLMRNMDEKDVRSINGVRVTEDMLDLVYKKETFKEALKVIRIWAKRRNIYANALGFLGGVSWAILVCRICQLYPNASPSMIIHMFFKIFSQWPWPKPVRLRETEYIHSLSLPIWDPRHNSTDQYHLMPILTPSYPAQNSTYNVTRSNRIIIERELANGLAKFRDILLKKRPWSDLFEPAFFFSYKHYVIVYVGGKKDDKNSFVEVCGLVESKLRVLVGALESNRYVKMAHVNCSSFGPSGKEEEFDLVKKWLIGMEFNKNFTTATSLVKDNSVNNEATNGSGDKQQPRLNIDLSDSIAIFEKAVERTLTSEDQFNLVFVKHVKKSQLSQHLSAEDMDSIKKQAATYAIQQAAAQKAKEAVATAATVNASNNPPTETSPLQSSNLPSNGNKPVEKENGKSPQTLTSASQDQSDLNQNIPMEISEVENQTDNKPIIVKDDQNQEALDNPNIGDNFDIDTTPQETEEKTNSTDKELDDKTVEEKIICIGSKRVFPENGSNDGSVIDTFKIQSVDESNPISTTVSQIS